MYNILQAVFEVGFLALFPVRVEQIRESPKNKVSRLYFSSCTVIFYHLFSNSQCILEMRV